MRKEHMTADNVNGVFYPSDPQRIEYETYKAGDVLWHRTGVELFFRWGKKLMVGEFSWDLNTPRLYLSDVEVLEPLWGVKGRWVTSKENVMGMVRAIWLLALGAVITLAGPESEILSKPAGGFIIGALMVSSMVLIFDVWAQSKRGRRNR